MKQNPPSKRGDDAIAIAELLNAAGFDTPAAMRQARAALEAAKLTNSRKQGIAAYKREAALELLTAKFAPVCGEACRALAPRGRTPVISRRGCEVCGGSNNRRAMLAAARTLNINGVRRVLIVGGNGEQRREIIDEFHKHRIAVDSVDGTSSSHSQKDADANMRRAGLMLIWGSTELRHAVSNLYTKDPPADLRVVTVARRSTEALCNEIVRSYAPPGRRR